MISVKRKTKIETRFHDKMGNLRCRVTRITKYLFGIIPLKIIHKYRETYHGNIKDCKNCKLSKI